MTTTMRISLTLAVAAALCTLPAAAFAGEQESAVIPTKWSLDKQVKKPARARSGKAGSSVPTARRPVARAKNNPRLYGGARVGNAGRRHARGGAQVGVAVPF